MQQPPDFSDLPHTYEAIAEAAIAGLLTTGRIALVGAPGTGKTMIARRLSEIRGPLTEIEQAEMRGAYRALGMALDGKFDRYVADGKIMRPFRAPHYTVSSSALASGSRGGELELARFGLLFLDEVVEFSHVAIDNLAHYRREMIVGTPDLVVATTPCACGWHGSTVRVCQCNSNGVERWGARTKKVLATLEITTVIEVPSQPIDANSPRCTSTAALVARVTDRGRL